MNNLISELKLQIIIYEGLLSYAYQVEDESDIKKYIDLINETKHKIKKEEGK